jgi:hypothetical protein
MLSLQIRIPKSAIRNLITDGRPAPAHIKLGAKWVEVSKRRDQTESKRNDEGEFENVASNTR